MFEIGTTLRDSRVRRNISLPQAEAETKIRVKYIQAMENEDFDVLPGSTYAKGFLRTYADYLDLDYQVVLDEYNERFGTGEHREHNIQPPRTARPKAPHKRQNYLFVAVVAVVIIAVLAYLGWGNSGNQQATLTPASVDTTTQTATGAGAASTGPATAPATATVNTASTPTRTQPVGLQSLAFSATSGDNWIEVRRGSASGEVIWGGTLSKGNSKSFTADALAGGSVWLKLGSTVGLQIRVNGQSQQVGSSVGAVFKVTPNGLVRQG